MKYLILFSAAIAVFLLLSFTPAPSWIKYTSAAGHFSIEFPGQPVESAREDTTAKQKAATIHFVTWFPNDSEGYMTTWTDLHKTYPNDKPIKELLEESRDGATKTINAGNVITTAIMQGKEPYIAFAFTSSEYTGRGRIYIINKVQYSIITLFSRSTGVSPNADRFIRSFKYLQ